jgi:putative dimethyl sulfoxide reductase chaperone
MSAVTALERPEVQRALGRAAVYQLLSLAFTYPDAESLAEVRAFIEDLSDHAIAAEYGIVDLLRSLESAARESHPSALAGEHSRLFAREVLCSAHETEYAFDPFAKSRQLADIAGFYEAWGVRVAQDRRGLPDFIATELEFVSLLLRKQVYALAEGWTEQYELAGSAASSFLEDHLGRWSSRFCRDVAEEAGDEAGFYIAAARLCDRFVAEEVRRSGVRPDVVRSRIIALDDTEAFQCGLAPAEPETEPETPADDGEVGDE